MNAKTDKKVSDVYNMPVQVSIAGEFLEDNDYKLLKDLHVAASCVNRHDGLVSKLDSQQQEIDELKAMVNRLRNNAKYCCDEEMFDELADLISISPEQCLLDHDNQVAKAHIELFAQQIFDAQLKVKQTIKVFPFSMATKYIKQLGGEK